MLHALAHVSDVQAFARCRASLDDLLRGVPGASKAQLISRLPARISRLALSQSSGIGTGDRNANTTS